MVRIWKTISACSVLVLALTACQQQATEQSGAAEEEVPTVADIRTTIEESNTAFEQAMLAGDAMAAVADYAADAVVQPPLMPPTSGQEAIQALYADMLAETPPSSFDIRSENVTVAESGELAYETGSYVVGGSTPEGVAWEDQGKYLEVWKKNAAGDWKVAALSWSPNAAPEGMPEAGGAKPEAQPAATPEGEAGVEATETEPAPAETN